MRFSIGSFCHGTAETLSTSVFYSNQLESNHLKKFLKKVSDKKLRSTWQQIKLNDT